MLSLYMENLHFIIFYSREITFLLCKLKLLDIAFQSFLVCDWVNQSHTCAPGNNLRYEKQGNQRHHKQGKGRIVFVLF